LQDGRHKTTVNLVQMLTNHAQWQKVIALHGQRVSQTIDIRRRELPVPRWRPRRGNQAFRLKEANLGDRHVHPRELFLQDRQDGTDRHPVGNRLGHLFIASSGSPEEVKTVLANLNLVAVVEVNRIDAVPIDVGSV
jgi:hypothetical protein